MESSSYAATRFVHWVSPPYGGTTTPRSIDAIGGASEKVTSVCYLAQDRGRDPASLRIIVDGLPPDPAAFLPWASPQRRTSR